jgi:hypothetical protein
MAQQAAYEHSWVFDSMKNTKEAIQTNYTSLQYLQTLDSFLHAALKPVALECPSLFYNYMAKVVARQTLKASAKLTSDDRTKLPIQLFNMLVEPEPLKAFEMSKLLYINRGIMFGFISFFLNHLDYYAKLQRGKFRLSDTQRQTIIHGIELSVGLRPGGNLYQALMEVIHWDNKSRWWKKLIIQKYTRMAAMQAQRTYTDFNHSVKLNDVVQIYMLTVNKAIDRCDSRQGVLTTFIQNWFKSARGEVAHLAETQGDESIDSLAEQHGDAVHSVIGVTLPDTEHELKEHVAWVAKKVDPEGLVRTCLGIEQYVTREQRQILETYVLEPSEEETHESA